MDPIDRDAIRSIVIKRGRKSGKTMMADAVEEVINTIINEFPSLEAMPVVRCKNCIHRPEKLYDDEPAKGFNLKFQDFRCPCHCDDGYYNWMPDDDWFCGNGEKEENDA